MTRVLVICPDKTGPLMAGTAIRSVEIARALADDFRVTLAVPAGSAPVAGAMTQVRVPSESTLPPLIAWADVVFVAGRSELMSAIRKPVIVDLYDPFILSDLEFYGERFNAAAGRPLLALRWLQHHLENGDLFVCASAVQRSFWLGMLASAGRVNRANHADDRGFDDLLAVVPFGVPELAPVHTRAAVKGVHPGFATTDRVVLWAGGLWNWVDPLTLLRAVAAIAGERPDVKALFLGTRHPNPQIGSMEMAADALALARELGLYDRRAFFLDWVPYEDRQNYLLESDVGVSLHQPGVEAQFAFRTRVLDYLWCGLPMVLSRGDELAGMVDRERLGVTVPEGDAAAVAGAITRLLDAAPVDRAARSAAIRESLSWRKVIEPIRRFCAAPRVAPDKTAGGWFEPGTRPAAVLRKEDALISDELVSRERELSPAIGDRYVVEHEFSAAYDNLCRVDLLVWPTPPLPAGLLRLTIVEIAADQRELARVDVPLAALPYNDWQRFEFRPIANARGRRYRLLLRACGVADSRIALWLCAPTAGAAAAPALVLHYLVKGLVDALPVATESFLFLHNTTVSEASAPGMSACAGAESLGPPVHDVVDIARPARPAEGNGAPTHGGAAEDDGAAAAVAGSAETDRLRAELARLTVELALTRRELEAVGARTTALADAPALPRVRRELVAILGRVLRAGVHAGVGALTFVLAVLTVPVAIVLAAAFAAVDALAGLRRRTGRVRAAPPPELDGAAAPRAGTPVSVVIPTWNGRELLAMSLPPLRAALAGYAGGGEIIVVDNGSDDDSREYLAREFPEVRVIALLRNEGFAGATNRGVAASAHRTVILLNNDMVVEADFIAPLVAAFDAEPPTFGVSCQIDFLDKGKARWETGKVHAEWRFGTIRLFHLDRFDDDLLYPVFFAGGGASAYDRAKFLALGGFDEEVFSPVYIEDVDLGYRAWKRGWPSLIQPRSVVHHKHRGTTRRLWSEGTIHSFFVKNLAALVQKNVTDWRLLARHLAGLVVLPLRVLREIGGRAAFATWQGLIRQVPRVIQARLREAVAPRVLDDATIFRVSRHRYAYRAHFGARPARAPDGRLRVLVVSPYSPSPAVHGGAVRMLALLERLAAVADVTLVSYADTPAELDPESVAALRALCREVAVLERSGHSPRSPLAPAKTRGFWSPAMRDTLEYFLDREDYDVVQVEYTHMAHFLPPPAPGLVRALVEHDVSFVSLARSLTTARSRMARLGLRLEWMRMLRYEIGAVERADLVITMSDTDRAVLGRFVAVDHARTIPNGVDCARFRFAVDGRDPETILFVGFFRHEPNVEAVRYFVDEVLPRVRAARPAVRFLVVGAYPPEVVRRLGEAPGIEVTGRVDDIGAYYRSSAVFVAPVLQGSGTRLKILEAMASGCPVVSTAIGAEGLGASDDVELLIRDSAADMAAAILDLLVDAARRAALARRARAFVETRYDWDAIAARLVTAYREALAVRPLAPPVDPSRPTSAVTAS